MSAPAKRTIQRFGWVPDITDFRDQEVTVRLKSMSALPDQVDLRKGFTPMEDQGPIGSCVGCSVVSALEFYDKRNDGHYTNRSRLFAYYEARVVLGTQDWDSGAMIRDAVKVAQKIGVPREVLWRYNIDRFAEKPDQKAYDDAAQSMRKVTSYARVMGLQSMLTTLATYNPVIFGFAVYESFLSPQVEMRGIVDMPDINGEAMVGGHAVVAVGYDMKAERVWCRNSWGPKWGVKGYFSLPFEYVDEDNGLADDFWLIRA
jgi:C1A family cysteine protease